MHTRSTASTSLARRCYTVPSIMMPTACKEESGTGKVNMSQPDNKVLPCYMSFANKRFINIHRIILPLLDRFYIPQDLVEGVKQVSPSLPIRPQVYQDYSEITSSKYQEQGEERS